MPGLTFSKVYVSEVALMAIVLVRFLVHPEMEMSLTENQFRMGFVIDNGKIGDGNFGCDCGAGDGLVWGWGVIKETRGTSRARARFMDLLCRVTAITVKGYERLCSVKFYV